jgi:hypothetical protein
MKYVQIKDDKIYTLFCCPQNPEIWPDYQEIEDDDPRYLAYMEWFNSVFPPL